MASILKLSPEGKIIHVVSFINRTERRWPY